MDQPTVAMENVWNETHFYCSDNHFLRITTQGLLLIYFLLGFGNIYTIVALLRVEELRKKRFTLLTVSLAISDQLVCLLVIPADLLVLSCDTFSQEIAATACAYSRLLGVSLVATSCLLTCAIGYIRHNYVLGGPNVQMKLKWVLCAVIGSIAGGVVTFIGLYTTRYQTCTEEIKSDSFLRHLIARVAYCIVTCSVYPFTYIRLRMKQNQSIGQVGLPVLATFQSITFKTGVTMAFTSSISLVLPGLLLYLFPWTAQDIRYTMFIRSFRYIQAFVNPLIYLMVYRPYRIAFQGLFVSLSQCSQTTPAPELAG